MVLQHVANVNRYLLNMCPQTNSKNYVTDVALDHCLYRVYRAVVQEPKFFGAQKIYFFMYIFTN